MQPNEPQFIAINFQKPIPLFPLPSSILLPHGLMPLHVFEERYKSLTTDALDSTGLIAIATFKSQPSHKQYLHGKPELRKHVCVGYTQQYDHLDDGRYLIMLQGLCRAKIVEEIDHQPYRKAMLQPTELQPTEDEQLNDARDQLQNNLTNPAFDQLEPLIQIRQLFDHQIPTSALIDLTIAQLCTDPEQRYAMLTQTDARSRAEWLNNNIDQLAETAITTLESEITDELFEDDDFGDNDIRDNDDDDPQNFWPGTDFNSN